MELNIHVLRAGSPGFQAKCKSIYRVSMAWNVLGSQCLGAPTL